jgi:HD-GYP domain-containing protein (c-di-GMP phosphodiesterase class II)
LKGDEIPLEASILAVADAYEAMTADRVYRPSLGHAAARKELERNAGTQFDAAVVAALLRGLSREARDEEAEGASRG